MTRTAGLRRVIRRTVRATVAGEPLRGAQVELLRTVEMRPGIGVAAAARALHMAGNSVSTLVNQLVDAGLLERRVDPDDRRAARLELTETAKARLANWRRARTELVSRALDLLSEEDVRALEAAVPALDRLLEAL
ncbi:MarR family winged helix-turn-helix transcriptional regulator [Amycolatopsis pigmentata]|uniref:MarR family winged helix-turn-helix transcriptional regulator n=1 Tax=Amycolatopsis pigmentata TaxID=450801 RepID=A0ABW5G894_9PSEU